MTQTERPPREGEPTKEWEYRDRKCLIYPVGNDRARKELKESTSPVVKDLYENSWCGYAQVEGDVDENEIKVFGGVTYHEGDWIGFDTMHGFDGGPQTLDEMKQSVEDMVDQLIEAEA